jgi:hypothetical protein
VSRTIEHEIPFQVIEKLIRGAAERVEGERYESLWDGLVVWKGNHREGDYDYHSTELAKWAQNYVYALLEEAENELYESDPIQIVV